VRLWVVLLGFLLNSGATQATPPSPTEQSDPPAPRLGITQSGFGPEAVFVLCDDCPTHTRKVLAPAPAPLRLAEPSNTAHLSRQTRSIHFPLASSRLTKEGRRALDAMRPLLLEAKSITITGHTDRVGKLAFNRRLAMRRAQTVRQALLDMGVPKERIVRVDARCCIEDPPPVNPPARRSDVEMLIVRVSHEQQP